MNNKDKRAIRTRAKLKNNLGLPRLTVFRSNHHIWAQLIDDKHGRTLLSASTKSNKSISAKDTKTKQAEIVGKQIAQLALKNKISKVRFDRGPYRFHGRVKALAQSARHNGLKF